MRVLGSPADTRHIRNPHLRDLVELRLSQLGTFRPGDGLLIVVEPADTLAELERVTGCSLLHDPFDAVPYGHPDYTPSFDYLEKHHDESGQPCAYEMHFDTGDDGLGVTLFIATEGINDDLLALCAEYAVTAVTDAD